MSRLGQKFSIATMGSISNEFLLNEILLGILGSDYQ